MGLKNEPNYLVDFGDCIFIGAIKRHGTEFSSKCHLYSESGHGGSKHWLGTINRDLGASG